MDSFDLDADGSTSKHDEVDVTSVKMEDVISKIHQLPQTTQLTDVKAIQMQQQEAHDLCLQYCDMMRDQQANHDRIVDLAADIQKKALDKEILKRHKPYQKQFWTKENFEKVKLKVIKNHKHTQIYVKPVAWYYVRAE